MRVNRTKLRRLEALALNQARRTFAPAGELVDEVLATAEWLLAGDIGAPANWTNAPAALVAHREKLLEWVRTKVD